MISPAHCDNLYFRISGYTDIPSCYILFFSFPDLNFSFTVFLGPNLTNQLQLNEVDLKTSLNRLYKEPKICWTEIASSLNRGFLILFLVFFLYYLFNPNHEIFWVFFLCLFANMLCIFSHFGEMKATLKDLSLIVYLFYHIVRELYSNEIRIIFKVASYR